MKKYFKFYLNKYISDRFERFSRETPQGIHLNVRIIMAMMYYLDNPLGTPPIPAIREKIQKMTPEEKSKYKDYIEKVLRVLDE